MGRQPTRATPPGQSARVGSVRGACATARTGHHRRIGSFTAYLRARAGWLVVLLATTTLACAPRTLTPERTGPSYVFAWPFADTSGLATRGGTTRGEPVTLAETPSAAWTALRAPDLIPFERDRRAILAMAGDFRTSFDFLETIIFTPPWAPARPYRSWGTERVYVVEDRGNFISLQHILVMFVTDEDGVRQGPLVQKHWRQDWQYEPASVLEYVGRRTWQRRSLDEGERRGRWSQAVFQVDDTPRYTSTGRWEHHASYSLWSGARTGRPLPRREHTVRDDYDLLEGENRHTILPGGWVHEQDNLKQVLASGMPVAREIGVNRYERIRDFDFSAGDAYWQATGPLWALVRDAWDARIANTGTMRVATACEGTPVFMQLFGFAAQFETDEPPTPEATRTFVDDLLACIIS